jgi:hypothetical protein
MDLGRLQRDRCPLPTPSQRLATTFRAEASQSSPRLSRNASPFARGNARRRRRDDLFMSGARGNVRHSLLVIAPLLYVVYLSVG